MLCKENYKVVIIMRFLLHQSIVAKCSSSMLYSDWILIRIIETNTYYVLSLIKEVSCFHKLRYERYVELIFKCLLDDMYTELIRMRISYEEITYVYKKAHMMIV
jgi:hypothetical protein